MHKTLFFLLLLSIRSFGQLPIKAERAILLSTSEGSRMDVDISPDGKTIVFDLLGDLYIVPSKGGKAKQITRGLAYDRRPVWSPDGKHLAYISDSSGANHCWIMDADGRNTRQMDHGEELAMFATLSWAPDGTMVMVMGKLYHLAGGELPMPKQIDQSAEFSPDGRFIYYYHQDFWNIGKIDSLKQFDCHTGMVSKEFSPGIKFYNPMVSPDGRWMAYVSGISDSTPKCNLRLMDLRTGKDKLLAYGIDQFRTVSERYTFTSDSKKILIGYGGKLHILDIQTAKNDTVHFEANMVVLCGAFDYNTYRINHDSIVVRYVRSANRSPDGHHLVFGALNQIYMMDLPNGKPRLLTDQTDEQFQPVYSPDGKWIAYVTWNDTAGGNLWRVSADGGNPVRMSNSPGHFKNPVWTPNGKFIAVFDGSFYGNKFYDNRDLCQTVLFSVGNNKMIEIADSGDPRETLAFSPDGNNILFTYKSNQIFLTSYKLKKSTDSISTSTAGNFMIDKSTGKSVVKNYLNDMSFGTGIQEIVPSPDGRYYALVIKEDIYLAPVSGLPIEQVIGNDFGDNESPLIRITHDGGIDPHWENGGRKLTWSFANKFFSIGIDRLLSWAIKRNQNQTDSIITPDETIKITLSAFQHFANGTIVLQGAKVLTMNGSEIIDDATIVITDGIITKIGLSSDIKIPEGATIMDMRGKTIMPGLVDLHAHMGTTSNEALLCQQPASHLAYLSFGVTTARDPSAVIEGFGEQELLATGKMIGPRLFTSGDALLAPIKTLQDARSAVRKRAAFGGVIIKQYRQPTREQRQWVLIASKESGMNMTNEGDEDFGKELSMAIDGSTGSEHQYDFRGNIYNDVKGFYASSGTWLTPTLQQNFHMDFLKGSPNESYFYSKYRTSDDSKMNHFMGADYLDAMKDLAVLFKDNLKATEHPFLLEKSSIMASFKDAGARVTLGSHGDCVGIGAHYELWGLKMGGITNMQTLQAGTILAAEGLGMQQDIGSIEPGKIADLLILDANPLDKIENTLSIRYVMKDGILYESQTLNEVWPEKRTLPNWKYQSK
jgi:Tol biopolymer transport system component